MSRVIVLDFLAFNRIGTWFFGQLANSPAPHAQAPSPAPLPGGGPFADVPTDWDAEMGDAVSFLDRIGVLNGYPDQTLKLQRPITHDEFALALQRLQRWMDQEMAARGFAPPAVSGREPRK